MRNHIIRKASWNVELISEWITEIFSVIFVLFEPKIRHKATAIGFMTTARTTTIKSESIAVIEMQLMSSEKRKCMQFYAQRCATMECANSWCVFDQLTIMRFRLEGTCLWNRWWLRKSRRWVHMWMNTDSANSERKQQPRTWILMQLM